MQVIMSERVPIKIWSDDPEASAVQQLKNVASLPFIFKHVAAMPDVHWGMGATVGSVIATQGAVIPAAVGVDIGCGMSAWHTGLRAMELQRVEHLRTAIESAIPVGFNMRTKPLPGAVAWNGWTNGGPADLGRQHKALHQLGTLGGGNHFIELCEDEAGFAWVMLHSGSRGIGKQWADIYLKAAKEQCARHFVTLPDPDLAYLAEGTEDFKNYIKAVSWCQDYAKLNRFLMVMEVQQVLEGLGFVFDALHEDGNFIDCHHNYVTRENHFGQNVWLTRKGATSARLGQRGIIPGSMGTRSYIVEGLGNPQSFQSCSHGAGRKMGRNQAKKTFDMDDFAKQTVGVDCRKDEGVLDEIPGAYKSIDKVMEDQKDLVRPIHTLKQFICIKG